MTPDGIPVIGPTKIRNVFLNCGHGTLGWTMACGSAHILTDMIGGIRPAIETAVSIDRYSRHRWGHREATAQVGMQFN